jgi:hypothetical protein
MNFVRSTIALALASASFAALATPAEVVPVSYTFDQRTSSGSYDYYDGSFPGAPYNSAHGTPLFTELTDGVYGVEGWAADLGHGNAAEWVGWLNKPSVNIDFDFGQAVNIQQIKVGSTQDRTDDVVLPSIDVSYWNGASWVASASLVVPESSVNDRPAFSTLPHGFLDLGSLNITAQKIRVTAKFSSNGPWTFIDEVDFYGTTSAVPEPSTYGLVLAGLGVVAATALRKRKSA